MWTSCAALRLIRMKVQSTACAVAKPTTSHGAALRSVAEATSHAASRRKLGRRLGRRRARAGAGENDAVDMRSCPLSEVREPSRSPLHELRKVKGHEQSHGSSAAFRFEGPVMDSRQSVQDLQIGGTGA